MYKLFYIFLFLSTPCILIAQGADPPKWQFQGYQKYLQTTAFTQLPGLGNKVMLTDNLLHNRLKFKYFPTPSLTFHAEVRSRIFWGDQVRLFTDFIENTNQGSDDYFDWSAGFRDEKGYALHTTLDRFYGEWIQGQWEFRLGRQRVNWGISTTWNPNDIFNAYNFTDFDYEERPGSDALRIRRYLGFASSIEIAVNAFRNKEEATAALLGRFHTGTYDWQVLTGIAQENLVLGGGWAGNLGDASFKGETSWFIPIEKDEDQSFALTMGVDYTFEGQLYINGGFLYNSNGTTGTGDNLLTFELSARNLYPYRYAILAQGAYPVTPLLNTALVVVYSPGKAHATFLNPVITYSLAQNWDLDLIFQLLFQKEQQFKSTVEAGFLRIKWSF